MKVASFALSCRPSMPESFRKISDILCDHQHPLQTSFKHFSQSSGSQAATAQSSSFHLGAKCRSCMRESPRIEARAAAVRGPPNRFISNTWILPRSYQTAISHVREQAQCMLPTTSTFQHGRLGSFMRAAKRSKQSYKA